MNHQYDFEEDLISQRIPIIHVPNFQPLISSRRKFTQLNNETLINIELFLQQSKNKEIERIKQLKQKQKFIGEQINKQQMKKLKKLKQIETQEKQKTLKQCTFKPSINSKGQRRALAQFLENQNQHMKKVEAKKRNLKISIQSQKEKQSFHPKINMNARQSRKNSTPIYQRLYALKNKQNIVNNYEQYNSENTFKPVISQKSKKMSRNAPIDELLYGDALRRQEKSKDVLYTQSSEATKYEKPINLTNEKYAAQKFIREYFGVLENLGINLSIHYQVDYIMFNEILKVMGFLKQDQQSQDGISVYERSLVHDAYSIIEKFGVNARNVCVFLLGLIGIYHINPINFEEGQDSNPQKQFNLDQTDGRKMQKHFDTLFRNRLNCENFKKNIQKIQNQYSFQPKINKKSESLADKYRTQMLQQANELLENYPQLQYSIPQDGIISHTDLLILHKMAKQIEIKQKRQQNKNKDMQQCTFKPTTLSSMQQTLTNSKISNFDSKLGEKKSFELYNYYKNLQSKKQSLQVSRQVEDPECTFAPNLKKDKVNSSTTYAKQIDETLYRMHKGRQQKQQKDKLLERGQKLQSNFGGSRRTNAQNFRNTSRIIQNTNKSQQSQHEQNVPTLILDVNLGDRTDRINLYKQDEDRLEQVARQFAVRHDLDQESEEKLLELLQIQLNNVLEKIDQDEECEQVEHQ